MATAATYPGASLKIQHHSSVSEIPHELWDSLTEADFPFLDHAFLRALELGGCVGHGTGWSPRHLTVWKGGKLVGSCSLYLKSHSYGEYIFDWEWAHAFERYGIDYYPKMISAVPFTPATGRRLLTRPGLEEMGQSALIQGAVQLASENRLSSVHVTFCTEAEAKAGDEMGLMHRLSDQFHWLNQDYADFDAFLADLSSRKRKNIRKERQQAQAFGGEIIALTGDAIEPEHWDAFWRFYQDTGSRKWGSPYLTRDFFHEAQETLRNDILLVLAVREGRYVAGALNFIGRKTLYGRYWGCTEHHPCLHFELCYYQAIDYAIANGLSRVEAGAQGEHKLARGYLPTQCHSLHWIADEGFRRAVAEYLDAERAAVDNEIEVLTSYGPFRQENREEQE